MGKTAVTVFQCSSKQNSKQDLEQNIKLSKGFKELAVENLHRLNPLPQAGAACRIPGLGEMFPNAPTSSACDAVRLCTLDRGRFVPCLV